MPDSHLSRRGADSVSDPVPQGDGKGEEPAHIALDRELRFVGTRSHHQAANH